jgi:hypothetical protein
MFYFFHSDNVIDLSRFDHMFDDQPNTVIKSLLKDYQKTSASAGNRLIVLLSGSRSCPIRMVAEIVTILVTNKFSIA